LIRIYLLLLALYIPLAGISQNATIKLRINPSDNFRVRINDGEIHHTNQFVVFPGENKVSIWAPGYLVIDTILDLKVDQQRIFTAHLEESPEYKDWLEEKRLLNEKAIKMQVPAGLITLSAAVFTAVQQVQFLQSINRLENAVNAYDLGYTPNVFNDLKLEYNNSQDNYKKQRTELIVGYSLTAVSTAFLIYQIKKAAKIKIPEFVDPHKLQFEGISYIPGDNRGPAQWQSTFSFKF